jgi:CRISPR system Cascade subunit CasA
MVTSQPRFDLLTEPWIPTLDLQGELATLSLLDTFRRAHTLKEIRDASPLVTYGLYRLLQAIVQDSVNPREKRDWLDHFRKGRLDDAFIDRLITMDGDRFDLFNPTHPFGQSGDLPMFPSSKERKELEPTTVGRLRAEIPSVTNVNHFRHSYDERQAFCPQCLARSIVTLAPFAKIDGRGYMASINGSPPVYVYYIGDSLFQSLAWNLVLPNYRPISSAGNDSPSWRADGRVPASAPKRDAGFVGGLTWQPRRLRLLAAPSGNCSHCGMSAAVLVHEILWSQGYSRPKDSAWWRDPFVAYSKGGPAQPRAVQPRPDRVLWRDYADLFLPDSRGEGRYPAAIVQQVSDLIEDSDEFGHPTFECFSYRTENAKVFEWRQDALPFSSRLMSDEARSQAVRASLTRAEEVSLLLKQSLKKLYPRDGKGNRNAFMGLIDRSLHSYWSALAEPFRQLVTNLDLPTSDPEIIEQKWTDVVRFEAKTAVELVIDSLDANAESLRRAAQARRLFYGGLKRKLPAVIAS